jgi:hypothetical protein
MPPGDSGGDGPAKRDKLEGGSVACAQGREAEHEEQRGNKGGGDAMRPKRPAIAIRKTTESVVIPPMRSANQPPRTRVALPVSVAKTVRLSA